MPMVNQMAPSRLSQWGCPPCESQASQRTNKHAGRSLNRRAIAKFKGSTPALIGLVVLLSNLNHSGRTQGPAEALKDIRFANSLGRKYLPAMKEPFLQELAGKDRAATVYRFLWLPSFHDPISVRFVNSDRGIFLYATRLKLDREYRPVRIVERRSVELKPVHWKRITDQLKKARFWDLPTHARHPFGGGGEDGHLLIVEGVRDGQYHVVMRDNPPGGNFVDLCQAMLFMSQIDVRKLWFEYR
ncbi:hypothetical protein [Aquisphaera giovannonii]|nr:hypothetical protein [Aquisphaera giovannonii]